MNLYHAITNRVSTRKYSGEPLSPEILQKVKFMLQGLIHFNPNIGVRLELITDPQIVKTTGIGFMGGMIKNNAPHCMIGITEKKDGCMENIGFLLEQAVLELQNEGISTCWLGTFNKEKIKSLCKVHENEEVAIVIAFGYAEKSFYNHGMRTLMSTTKRKNLREICFYQEWENNSSTYLLKKSSLKKILNMSSLAPSANNAQPVRVIVDDHKALFFSKINKKSECYKIDAGIFIAHFYLSCMEEGRKPTICIDQEESKNYNIPDDYIYIGLVRY